jgi:hypothetical protein
VVCTCFLDSSSMSPERIGPFMFLKRCIWQRFELIVASDFFALSRLICLCPCYRTTLLLFLLFSPIQVLPFEICINVNFCYLPWWDVVILQMYMLIIPLVVNVTGFFVSLLMRLISDKIGRQVIFFYCSITQVHHVNAFVVQL